MLQACLLTLLLLQRSERNTVTVPCETTHCSMYVFVIIVHFCYLKSLQSQEDPYREYFWRIDPSSEQRLNEKAFWRRHNGSVPIKSSNKISLTNSEN